MSEKESNSDTNKNIKPIKDSWNREEVIKLLKTVDKHVKQYNHYFEGIDKWVEENL